MVLPCIPKGRRGLGVVRPNCLHRPCFTNPTKSSSEVPKKLIRESSNKVSGKVRRKRRQPSVRNKSCLEKTTSSENRELDSKSQQVVDLSICEALMATIQPGAQECFRLHCCALTQTCSVVVNSKVSSMGAHDWSPTEPWVLGWC